MDENSRSSLIYVRFQILVPASILLDIGRLVRIFCDWSFIKTLDFFCLQVGDSTVDWYDREENYSMVVQAVVDSDLRFRDVFSGLPGSVTDSGALRNSGLYRRCENEEILRGPVQLLHVSFVNQSSL